LGQLRLRLEHVIDPARALFDREVGKPLDQAVRDILQHGQVKKFRGVGKSQPPRRLVRNVPIDDRSEVFPPGPGIGCDQGQLADRQLGAVFRGVRIVIEPYDHGL